ncbi:hypothetical protein I315_03016 [Cryptococcus gattii Ru294]|nr:hypothetical protein I315_03016 [Cryptococcus gattii Ru294]
MTSQPHHLPGTPENDQIILAALLSWTTYKPLLGPPLEAVANGEGDPLEVAAMVTGTNVINRCGEFAFPFIEMSFSLWVQGSDIGLAVDQALTNPTTPQSSLTTSMAASLTRATTFRTTPVTIYFTDVAWAIVEGFRLELMLPKQAYKSSWILDPFKLFQTS